MTEKRNCTYTITAVIIAIILITSFIVGSGALTARAAASAYSDVMQDLKKDESFNADEYSVNDKDYSLKVIQIAESTAGELLIYVYQPAANSRKLTATSINISSTVGESAKWHNYKLELLDENGVFQKYRVQDFELKADKLRYYDISSIFRKWLEDIDEGLPSHNENDINEVAFEVGQEWTSCTINGEVSYHMETTETIEVTDKYIGYLRYTSDIVPPWVFIGIIGSTTHYDSHYIAFNTDMRIDELLAADVYYVSRPYEIAAIVPVYGEKQKNEVHLTYKDKQTVETVEGAFWQEHRYTWDRIQSVAAFVDENKETLTDEEKTDLLGKKWILRFVETSTNVTMVGAPIVVGTQISEVTILRLKFKTDGKVYNLGAIDNKQSEGSGQKPGNEKDGRTWLDDLKEFCQKIAGFFAGLGLPWWAWLLIAPAAIIAVIFVVMFVIWLIKLPFRKLKSKGGKK